MAEPLACLNGRYLPFSECRLPVTDLGLVQGATVTERVRTFSGRPFLLEEHLQRFNRSLAVLGFAEDPQRLTEIVARLLSANVPALPSHGDLNIVLFATPGAAPPGTRGPESSSHRVSGSAHARPPTLCVSTLPIPFERWSARYATGEHLVIPSVRQVPPEVLDPRIKHRSRLHWYLADRAAQTVDPEAAALLLDLRGFVTETAVANVLIVRNGALLTPREGTTLDGISLRYVAGLAADLGIGYDTADLRPEDLSDADEVLLSSTSYCLLPVTRIDGRAVSGGAPGPLFHRLIAEWSRRVGVDIVEQAQRAGGR